MYCIIRKVISLCLLLDRMQLTHSAGLRSAAIVLPRPAVLINTTDETLENSPQNSSIDSRNDTTLSYHTEDYHFNITTETIHEETFHNISMGSRNISSHPSEQTEKFDSYVQWAVGCGGTLIYEDIVLSAAHCYNPRGHISDRVWVGSNTFRNGEQRKIINFIPHPQYSDETYQYDFLILKLDSPVQGKTANLNRLKSIPLEGNVLTAIGFGNNPETDFINREEKSILKEGEVDYVLSEECQQLYGEQNVNDKVNICAEIRDKELCKGENSGGPIFSSGGLQVGVASWNNGCDEVGYPGVYARVSHAYSWIQNQICMQSSNPPSECVPISIDIASDAHPSEIRWSITGDNGDDDKNNEQTIYYSYLNVKPNGYVEKPLMIVPGSYRFDIVDSYGDGMEGGWYSIWTGKDSIHRSGDFNAFDSVEFTVESDGTKKSVVVEKSRVLEVDVLSTSSVEVVPVSPTARSLEDEPSQQKLHSIKIEVKYDDNPTETSWSLFRKPGTEIYNEPFNGTHVPGINLHITVDDLISGEYWFRILDDEYNGICCVNGEGSYKILDITDGKSEIIHESNGEFYWYEFVEFKLHFEK